MSNLYVQKNVRLTQDEDEKVQTLAQKGIGFIKIVRRGIKEWLKEMNISK